MDNNMKNNKAYTNLEQSTKLAEILPIESADQTWARVAIAGANLGIPEELQYRHGGDTPFEAYSGIGIPCWSLAALIEQLDETVTTEDGDFELHIYVENSGYYVQYEESYDGRILVGSGFQEYLMDAVYDVIIKLNEFRILEY